MAESIVTRTLLLTDIVGSTKLVEEMGDAPAAELQARVDRIVRDVVAATGGTEIDKTDGFLLLFPRALDGLRCAQRIHAALEALSVEVGRTVKMRAGLHVGEVVLRENTLEDTGRGAKPIEVDGLAKPMAARIMSLAGGGQTLLTRPARELAKRAAVGDDELGSLKWANHGPYRLAGVSEPLDVYEAASRRPRRPATSDKVRRVRSGIGCVLPALFLLVLGGGAAALGWSYLQANTYTTTHQGPAQVTFQGEQQAAFVAAWEAFARGDVRDARARIDGVAAALPRQPDVRLAQLAFTYADLQVVPEELQTEIDGALASVTSLWEGPDAKLVDFVERWKLRGGYRADDLHDEIQAFRETYPDHLVALLLAIDLAREQERTDELAELIAEAREAGFPLALGWQVGADVQVAASDFTGAEATLTDGLAQFPGSEMLRHGLADLRFQRGDAEGALAVLEPLLAATPGPTEARATTVAALLSLGRIDEAEPLLEGFETEGTPPERVAFALEVARGFVLNGRLGRARSLLDVAYTEAEGATLSEAWVDAAMLDLEWATNPDLSTPSARESSLQRAKGGLLLPWMSEAASLELRSGLLSAQVLDAWLGGDVEKAKADGAMIDDGGADPLGAMALIRVLDDPDAIVEALSCVEAREMGRWLFHSQEQDRARAAYAAATAEDCVRAYGDRPAWAAAEAHQAALDFAAGETGDAAQHTLAFRELWGAADPELPVFRDVRRIEQSLAGKKGSGRGKRRKGKRRRR